MKRKLPNRYARLVRKYLKFKARLEQQIQNGRFAQFTKRKRRELLHRLERYQRRIAHLAGATAATSLGILMPNLSQAQTFCDNVKNPLEIFFNDSRTAVEFADLDGDGDMDAFASAKDSGMLYYENVGDNNNPAFIRINRDDSPFPNDGAVSGFKSAYSAVDIDGDGDLDIFAGEKYSFDDRNGKVFFYENIGDANNPVFEERFEEDNPLSIVDVGNEALPFLADLDADGDLDAAVGSDDGIISYFENVGTASSPSFEERTDSDNPFNGIDVGRIAAPDLADIDEDGDLDLVIGEYYGSLKYYENIGNSEEAIFEERTGDENPFANVQTSSYALPNIVDIDNDGDLDLLVSQYAGFTGTIVYYENKPACLPESIDGLVDCNNVNPFEGIDVGSGAAPDFADLDGDGDFDAVVGNTEGTLKIFENKGTATRPRFKERILLENPFTGVEAKPDLVDLDADGDIDVAIGQQDGTIKYYENNSTATEFIFDEKVDDENPFNGIQAGFIFGRAVPELADLDGDEDLDLIVGGGILKPEYHENTGSPSNPIFEERNDEELFQEVQIRNQNRPKLVDYDGDGDLDLFVTDFDKCVNYYENTGSEATPVFELQGGKANPFNLTLGSNITSSFVDIDDDGDLDAFVGQADGTIRSYKNTTLSAEAFVTDCDKEEGDLVLNISSGEEAGPYIIANAFSTTIGKRNQTTASASVPTAGLEDGLYVFEITPKGNLCDITIVTSAEVGEDCEIEDRSFEIEAVNTQANLEIFPNPTAAVLNYDVNHLNLKRVYMVDQLGRIVKNTRQIDGQLNISDLANGTYILVLESETELLRKIIVKQD